MIEYEVKQKHYKMRKYWEYILLVAIAMTLCSMLTITHIRMYGHDTRGWMLPSRTWFVGMLRHGDLPVWFGLVRYGFPTIVAQFSAGFWSPVAAIMSLFGDYGPASIAYEFLVWRLLALFGTWWFARSHISHGVLAWAAACTFVGAGSFASQEIGHYAFFGMSVVPWILGAIDRCVQAVGWRDRCFGAGVLGLAGSTLLWSGYPGIWLMLPVYSAPYVIMLISEHKSGGGVKKSVIGIISGLGIIIMGVMPIIMHTLQFIVFGDKFRVATDPNYGLLPVSGLLGFFLANPSYIANIGNAKNAPVYIGLIPVIGFISYIIGAFRYRSLIIQKTLCIVLLIANIVGTLIGRVDVLITCILVQAAMFSNKVHLVSDKKYYKYIVTVFWIILWTTPGTYTDYVRGHVFPFSMVRWQAMQMYLVDIFTAVMGWSIVGELVMKKKQEIRRERWFESSQNDVMRGCLVIGIVCLFVFSPPVGMSEFALGQVEHFGATPLVWTAVTCIGLSGAWILAYVIARLRKLRLGEFSFGGAIFGAVFLVACGAYTYSVTSGSNPPDWWYQMVVLPDGSRAALDIGHLVVVSGLAVAAVRVARSPAWLLNTLILIGVTDVSVASLRYLGDTEMVNVERVREQAVVPQVTSNRRFDGDAGPNLIALASSAPHMWVYPGAMPDVARVDHEWGVPSVFHEFAVFPSAWTELQGSGSTDETRDVAVSSQSLHGQVDEGASQPWCALGDPASAPVVTIHRFLSTIIDVTVVSPCGRLLVWTDTWSEGWTATLNGVPTTVYRVNGGVRGVMITSGETRLSWRYRPTGFLWSLGVMCVGLVVSLILISWGLLDVNALWTSFLLMRVSKVGY